MTEKSRRVVAWSSNAATPGVTFAGPGRNDPMYYAGSTCRSAALHTLLDCSRTALRFSLTEFSFFWVNRSLYEGGTVPLGEKNEVQRGK